MIFKNHLWRKIMKKGSVSLFIFSDLILWLIVKHSELLWTFSIKK
jgi:hypothetical protein